jgi:hypothetical protein
MTIANLEIKPNEGCGDILFGTEMEPFVKQMGEPEEVENFDDDENLNTTLLHYWKAGVSIFFVGLSTQVLAGIELDSPDTILYGEKIMGKSEEEIITLMKKNGNSEFETENEMGDKRLSFDVGMMDFFFRDGKLVYMNFGVLVDEDGNIEKV